MGKATRIALGVTAVALACAAGWSQDSTFDFIGVGESMESAAAEENWDSVYVYAAQITAAAGADLTDRSADELYCIGLAHMYLMARAFDIAEEGLQDSRAEFASKMSQMVLNPYEDVRVISHGEQVTLTDYLVPGQTAIFDFSSEYCPPCTGISPYLQRLARDRDDIILVTVDINRPGHEGIDWGSPVARQYDLRRIPAFKIYGPEGELVAEGDQARQMVIRWLQEMEG